MQEKLLLLRKRHNYSQEYMAEQLGLSRYWYGQKELGVAQFTSDEMFKARDIFDERLEDIFLPRGHQIGYKDK